MIEIIKEKISKNYNLDENKGFFVSCFDINNNLILSNGVLITDKSLNKVIDMIYHGLIEKNNNIKTIICDIVTSTQQKATLEEVNNINLSNEGICIQTIDNSKSGVLLPGTSGIHNIQEAFNAVKKKNNIEGNINIYSFKTDRITII